MIPMHRYPQQIQKNTQCEPSVLSTSKSIKQRKALAPRIDEEKASLDTEHAPHVRYSKSMQAYGTKTKLNKTLVTRQDTAPPVRSLTALRNAKSADQAQDMRSEVTTRETTMIVGISPPNHRNRKLQRRAREDIQ
eukprot:133737_1